MFKSYTHFKQELDLIQLDGLPNPNPGQITTFLNQIRAVDDDYKDEYFNSNTRYSDIVGEVAILLQEQKDIVELQLNRTPTVSLLCISKIGKQEIEL